MSLSTDSPSSLKQKSHCANHDSHYTVGNAVGNFGAVGLLTEIRYSNLVALIWAKVCCMNAPTSGLPLATVPVGPAKSRHEVRCAVRFPLRLPLVLSSGSGEFAAQTRNVSASGLVFELDRPLKVGIDIHFSLRMPGTVLGTAHDILVHCAGRVVRCSLSQSLYEAAATINEYRFAEQ
jgi:hypothetical protein